MDGDGREQIANFEDGTQDGSTTDAQGSPTRPEGRGEDRHGGGAFTTDRSDKAVNIQGIVDEEAYSGSAESGV